MEISNSLAFNVDKMDPKTKKLKKNLFVENIKLTVTKVFIEMVNTVP